MPLESNFNFNSLVAMITLLADDELEALAFRCNDLIKNRQQIQREEFRQKLMENLQKAIEDILHNNFYLMIEDVDSPNYVLFMPNEENYNIEIK